MWRLRRKTERGWNDGFHINTKAEAEALRDLLNDLEGEVDEVWKYNKIATETALKLEGQRNEAREQRDRITTIARELLAMIRINVMVGRFAECTVEQIDEHLKPWIDKIAAVKGGSDE
jgi:hypothetical protein